MIIIGYNEAQEMPTIPGAERVFEYSSSRPQQFPLVRTPTNEFLPNEQKHQLHSPIQNKKPGTSSNRTNSSSSLISSNNSEYNKRSVSNEVGTYKKNTSAFQHTIASSMFKNAYVAPGHYDHPFPSQVSQLPKVYIYI